MGEKVAIIGTGQTKYSTKRWDVSMPELVREAAIAAISDAGINFHDIDAVVFGSAPEAFEGVNCPDKSIVDYVGALGKPWMRVHTGGATGASAAMAGYHHIASGMFDTVLVVAMSLVGESPNAQYILNTIYDPIYEKDIRLNVVTAHAMRGQYIMKEWGITEEHMAKVSVKNHLNGLKCPYAHLKLKIGIDDVLKSRLLAAPIKLLDMCPRSSGACAVVMASEEKAKKLCSKPVWVKAINSVEDGNFMGDRDVPYGSSLPLAAARAYKMAGITDPLHEIDVAELQAPSTVTEIIHYVCLNFCKGDNVTEYIDKGIFEMDGELAVHPSGGPQCANPIGASGLVHFAEIASQLMGKCGERQVPGAKTGIASAVGGFMQMCVVGILGTEL